MTDLRLLRIQLLALREQAAAVSLQAETLYHQIEGEIAAEGATPEGQAAALQRVFGESKSERKHFMEGTDDGEPQKLGNAKRK